MRNTSWRGRPAKLVCGNALEPHVSIITVSYSTKDTFLLLLYKHALERTLTQMHVITLNFWPQPLCYTAAGCNYLYSIFPHDCLWKGTCKRILLFRWHQWGRLIYEKHEIHLAALPSLLRVKKYPVAKYWEKIFSSCRPGWERPRQSLF